MYGAYCQNLSGTLPKPGSLRFPRNQCRQLSEPAVPAVSPSSCEELVAPKILPELLGTHGFNDSPQFHQKHCRNLSGTLKPFCPPGTLPRLSRNPPGTCPGSFPEHCPGTFPGTRPELELCPEPSQTPWFGTLPGTFPEPVVRKPPRHHPGTYIGKEPIAKAVGEQSKTACP